MRFCALPRLPPSPNFCCDVAVVVAHAVRDARACDCQLLPLPMLTLVCG